MKWLHLDAADLPEPDQRLLRRRRPLLWASALALCAFAVAEYGVDPPAELAR